MKHQVTLRQQTACLGLLDLAVAGALWQKGEPLFTLAMLVLIPLAGLLARLRLDGFPKALRQGAQAAVACLGAAWFYSRCENVPVDLALVETAAAFGLALAIAGNEREYALLGLISIILVGYGALTPERTAFQVIFVLYVLWGAAALYQGRIRAFAGASAGETDPGPAPNRGYQAAHFGLCCLACAVMLALAPWPERRETFALIPVDFDTRQTPMFPLSWRDWLGSVTTRLEDDQNPDGTARGKAPAQVGRDPRSFVSAEQEQDAMDARGGAGAGMGKDLVFRVRTPVRLYWLARLYDAYDGQTWKKSETAASGKDPLDRVQFFGATRIRQYFRVEKNVAPYLVAAFRPYRFRLPENDQWRNGSPTVAGTAEFSVRWAPDRNTATLAADPPPAPWRYQAYSVVPTMPLPSGDHGRAAERQRRAAAESGYRQIHPWLVSARMRRLGEELVRNCPSPLAQALALQNYLRANYTYTLQPEPAPAEAEPIDHFLFESRKGYCQHYAQALAVLARLVGLPARVAAGYAPGNYNLLTGYYEIREFHAHAWTQIYVVPYGWLTFDGVPPAQLQLQNVPTLIGNLKTPFAEEWDARPPELSLAQAIAREQTERKSAYIQQNATEKIAATVSRVYDRAALQTPGQPPGLRELAAVGLDEARRLLKTLWHRLRESVATRLDAARRQALASARRLREIWIHVPLWANIGTLVGLTGALLLLEKRAALAHRLARALALRRCARLWRELATDAPRNPGDTVRICYEIVTEALGAAAYKRPGNVDLIEYVAWLGSRVPELAGDLNVVAAVFARQHFGGRDISVADARSALESTARLRVSIPKTGVADRRARSSKGSIP